MLKMAAIVFRHHSITLQLSVDTPVFNPTHPCSSPSPLDSSFGILGNHTIRPISHRPVGHHLKGLQSLIGCS